jgi:hypothetical protein
MRHFETNQNGETRIKLRKKDSDTGKNTKEWAYAPYMSFSETAWGPLVSMLLGLLPLKAKICHTGPCEGASQPRKMPECDFRK